MADTALPTARPRRSRKPLKLLFSRSRIRRRVRELAAEIRRDYQGRTPVLVAPLKGAFVFLADLIRALDMPLEVDFVRASSYGTGTKTAGRVALTDISTIDVSGRPVLLVEDIVDTALTLETIRRHYLARGPADLRVCALLARRSALDAGAVVEYLGFAVPDGFVVGYGIDYAERYRHLPDIHVLEGP